MWLGAAVAALVLALTAGSAVWLLGSVRDGDVRFDLALPKEYVEGDYFGWEPVVVNKSGKTLEDAEIAIAFVDPHGGHPPVIISDQSIECEIDGEDVQDMDACEERRAEQENCRYTERPDEYPHGAKAECVKDLGKGENRLSFEFQPWDGQNVADFAKPHRHPNLAVRVSVTVSGITVAATEVELPVAADPELHRVESRDFPETLTAVNTESDPVEWSFTFTNDTDEDIQDGQLSVAGVEYDQSLGMASGSDACVHDDQLEGDSPIESVDCEVSIRSGEERTFTMRTYRHDGVDYPENMLVSVRIHDWDTETSLFADVFAAITVE